MKEIVEALKKRISENKNSMLVTVVAGTRFNPAKSRCLYGSRREWQSDRNDRRW